MRNIDDKLLKFLEVDFSSITEVTTKIETEIKDYDTHSTEFKSALDTYYNSQNKGDLLAKVDTVSSLSKEITESSVSFITPLVSKGKELQSLIGTLKGTISNINALSVKEDEESKNRRNQLINHFDNDHEKARKLFSELAAMTFSFKKVEEVAKPITLPTPTGGTFTKQNFKASNGMTFDYYIYIPEGVDPTQKLPLHMYMHGYGERGNKVLNHSLPKMLAEGYKPSGIVVCPQMPADKYNSFQNQYMLPALAEFTQVMSNSYNVDKNRVSISGHSDGAIGGFKLAQMYPNLFSAFVPISGTTKKFWNESELHRLKIFSFFGDGDDQYRNSALHIRRVNGYQHVFVGAGHAVQNQVFNKQYKYADGQMYYPLDWAFMQTKG